MEEHEDPKTQPTFVSGDEPTMGTDDSGSEPFPFGDGWPSRVGPYKIIKILGEGGMGSVYLAEQVEPVVRQVALKLVKKGLATEGMVARFRRERQTLALMNHPNIAVVHEAGTDDDGHLYFAMEYLDGLPITKYCDIHQLDIDARLNLFLQVCQGIQHAHQKMVIHRDIKPSNVLVVQKDGKPVPKVIDFGIAKAFDPQFEAKTLVPDENPRPLGTPQYMSPEQIQGAEVDIDTRADVYALGVLLYELLCGTLPFKASKNEIYSLIFKILEQEPPRPSEIYSQSLDISLAKRRNTEPGSLKRRLEDDLDWIVLRALEKDRNRRYNSANELADDIERHLNHEPVRAAHPSAKYLFSKFMARHRRMVLTTTSLVCLLLFGIFGTTVGMVRATKAKEQAQQADAKSQKIIQYLQSMLASPDPSLGGRDVKVVDLLDKASENIPAELGYLPEVEASIRKTIGWTYLELGRYAQAESHLTHVMEIQEKVLGANHPETLNTANAFARLRYKQGQYEEAEQLARSTYEVQMAMLGESHPDTQWSLYNLAKALDKLGRLEEAEILFSRNVEVRTQNHGAQHPHTLISINSYTELLGKMGKLEKAEHLLQENVFALRDILGPMHPNTLNSMNNLASIMSRLGKHSEAELLARQTLKARLQLLGEDHPQALETMDLLATILLKQNKLDEAENLNRKTMDIRRRVLGSGHPETINSVLALAKVLNMQQRYDQVAPLYAQVLAWAKRQDHPNIQAIADYQRRYADSLVHQERFREAEPLLKESLSNLENTDKESLALQSLIQLYHSWGKQERAKPYLQKLKEI